MSRGTWVYRDGELVEKHIALAEDYLSRPQRRSSLPCPYVQSDYVLGYAGSEVQSMGDGKTYDSKSQLRRSYKERGLVELGNDAPRHDVRSGRMPLGNAVKDAYRKVKAGYKPPPLETGIIPDA